ncbi:E1-E2 ATPase [delta proteobacterium NaphS2]|nr:E1-E2 ATPase [delta proteobacterium NaphS2]
MEITVETLVPSDVILLEPGDRIPADCRVTESYAIRVNNATITGEWVPKAHNAEASREEEPLRSSNVLLAGTSLVSGKGRALVFATGMDTEFGKIAHLSQRSGEEVSPLRKEIAYLSRLIAFLAIGIGMVFFVAGAVLRMPLWQDIIFSIFSFNSGCCPGVSPGYFFIIFSGKHPCPLGKFTHKNDTFSLFTIC